MNIRDKWDSTPLYYACLCGHEEMVKYLLDNGKEIRCNQCDFKGLFLLFKFKLGAKCDLQSFDGERCQYGALTNKIRDILREYKVVTSHIKRRDQYELFLEQ